MKVAFLSPFTSGVLSDYLPALKDKSVPQGMGGSAVFELVIGLIKSGVDLHLITLHPGLNKVLEYHNGNVNYYIIPRRLKHCNRDFWIKERKLIKDVLFGINPDVLHANWTYEYSLAALDYNRDKTLVTTHDIPWKVLRYSNFYYLPSFFASIYIYRKARWIVFVSNSVKKYASIWLSKNCKSFVIPNIVDLSAYNLNLSKHNSLPQKYFVSIGLWNKLKNLKTSIRAFNYFVRDNPDYYYILIGPGLEPNSNASEWVRTNKLEKNVIFLGKLSREETLCILKNASALIHPSLTESFSMVVAEAMWLEVPVIAGNNSDGVTELLGGGKYGIVVNPKSPDAINFALNKIIQNPQKIKAISEEAKRYISKFSMQYIVAEYLKIYEKVLIKEK